MLKRMKEEQIVARIKNNFIHKYKNKKKKKSKTIQ
jgi:hypothetical protein